MKFVYKYPLNEKVRLVGRETKRNELNHLPACLPALSRVLVAFSISELRSVSRFINHSITFFFKLFFLKMNQRVNRIN